MKNLTSCCKGIIYLLVLALMSCERIYIPDPIDPRLPKYTEKGYDVAGAFINGVLWKSVVSFGYTKEDQPYMRSFPEKDSLILYFFGNSGVIEFHFSGIKVSNFEDLITLKNKKIELDGTKNLGYYERNVNYDTTLVKEGIGQIYFKNVTVNPGNAVLSGTFGFTLTHGSNQNTEISYGRFDYVFGEENDFRLE